MLYLRLLFPMLACLLLACNNTPEDVEQPVTDHELLTGVADTTSEAEEEKEAYTPPDSIALLQYAVDTTDLTPEPDAPIKILLEGLFHKQTVWQGAEKKQWLGLFDTNGSYELRPTTLQVLPAFDPVHDAETEMTTGRKIISGREVSGTEKNVMLFITGLTNYKAGPVDTASFDKAVLQPGQETVITFKKRHYRLQAFGDSSTLENGNSGYKNYGWKITGTKKGKKREQLLAQDELLAGPLYQLHWAGDLDRDGIPDLIAELSNTEGLSRMALFLSSRAGKGELYKQVAVFESYVH